mmetsp:Transcript_40426/g.114473  ORF Transcript_40426/g.114473 Transcript_40426/m.114473 type:complete len:1081 (+) Transcript_40426:226-3468(+)
MAGLVPGGQLTGRGALQPCPLLLACLLVLLRPAASQGALGWHFSAWGECDKSCGGGMQHRHAHCLDRYGQIAILDLVCGVPPAANETSRSCNSEPCGYFYLDLGGWSQCSSSCGYGWRTRITTCMAEGVALPGSDSSLCDGHSTVPLGEYCNTAPCPEDVSLWVVGDWQSCSRQCGPGTSNRTVECRTLSGAPAKSCAGPKPVDFVPCEIKPCNGTLCDRCGPRTASCSTIGVCTCEPGWQGPRCTVPSYCPSAVLDHSNECCSSGVLDFEGFCCPSGLDGSPAKTDRDGRCCAAGTKPDACGVCGGTAVTVDARGVCCDGPLDAGGYCCSSNNLDACGVCNGDVQALAQGTVCPEAVCGNGRCEMEESAWRRGANRCQGDCPLQLYDCPRGQNPTLGSSTYICSGRGSCLVSQGDCNCFHGYAGEACSQCISGWEATGSGTCVPLIVDSSDGEAPRPPVTPQPPLPPTVGSEDDDQAFPAWAFVLSATGGAILLLVGIFLLYLMCCRRVFSIAGLQLYPTDPVYRGDDTVLCQSAFFTPGEPLRRALPEEVGWEPVDPMKSLNPNLYGGKRPPFVPAVVSARTDNGGHLLNLPPVMSDKQELRTLRSMEKEYGVTLHIPTLITAPLPGTVDNVEGAYGQSLMIPPRPGAGLFLSRPVSSRPSSVQMAGRPHPGQHWQPDAFGTRPMSQPTTQQMYQQTAAGGYYSPHIAGMRPASSETVLRSAAAAAGRPWSTPQQSVPKDSHRQASPTTAVLAADPVQQPEDTDSSGSREVTPVGAHHPAVHGTNNEPPATSANADIGSTAQQSMASMSTRPKSRYIRKSAGDAEDQDSNETSSDRPQSMSVSGTVGDIMVAGSRPSGSRRSKAGRRDSERRRSSATSRSHRKLKNSSGRSKVNFGAGAEHDDSDFEISRRSSAVATVKSYFGGVSGFFLGPSASKRSMMSAGMASRESSGGGLAMQSFRKRVVSRFDNHNKDGNESDEVSMAASLTHIPLPSVFMHSFAAAGDGGDTDSDIEDSRWPREQDAPKDTADLAKLSMAYWVGDAAQGLDRAASHGARDPPLLAGHRPHVRHAGRIRFDVE